MLCGVFLYCKNRLLSHVGHKARRVELWFKLAARPACLPSQSAVGSTSLKALQGVTSIPTNAAVMARWGRDEAATSEEGEGWCWQDRGERVKWWGVLRWQSQRTRVKAVARCPGCEQVGKHQCMMQNLPSLSPVRVLRVFQFWSCVK